MSTGHRTSGINNSTSKHNYQFAKSQRFSSARPYNKVSCYDHKSQFQTLNVKPAAGFMSGSKRFGNTGIGNADTKNWAPLSSNYYATNFAGRMGKTSSQSINDLKNGTCQSYTFGVGRENMKKQHVDKIIKNIDGHTNVPGSGTYEYRKGFGGSSHDETTCYSMRKRLYMDELHLNKSRKLPGPGNYNHADCIAQKMVDSTKISSHMHSVSKAKDRFRIGRFNIPAPNNYNPKDELNNNFNSQRKFVGATIIGKHKISFMDSEWKNGNTVKEKAQGPGPGHYARFSDF
jgi:hypothetical protein